MTKPSPSYGEDDIERRLYAVTERLEHATNDLQTLVDQLRTSFSESIGEFDRGEIEREDRERENREAAEDEENGSSGPSGA